MNKELENTLLLIIDRTGNKNSVFIPMEDFSWYSIRDNQLKRLHSLGMIIKPRFFDNGAEIRLTEEGRNYFANKNQQELTSNPDDCQISEKPSVFISYNHGSRIVVEQIVNRLYNFADVHWDQNLGPWESFTSFMNTIRKQDFAVLIISDAYLKSMACLYEVIQLMTTENWDKKSMYLIEESAKGIYDIKGRAGYIDYWYRKEQELNEEIKEHSVAAVKDIAEEIQKVQKIKTYIGDFMKIIADSNNPDINESVEQIANRLKISAKRNSVRELENVIISLLQFNKMSISDLAIATNRSKATISNYLRKLSQEKRVFVVGEGKEKVFSAI